MLLFGNTHPEMNFSGYEYDKARFIGCSFVARRYLRLQVQVSPGGGRVKFTIVLLQG